MIPLGLIRSRFFTHTPYRLMHVVTSLCNARCIMCDQWKKSPEQINDLSLEEIIKMLENAKKAGIFIYTAWGGEPLLRKDLHLILKYAKKLNFITSIITNGYYLKKRCDELMPYIDSLVVSIDSNDDLHDKMRGINGIKDKAIEGIKICSKYKTKITINSVICKMNVDKIDGLVKLSDELSVPINFQPMDVFGEYNEKYRLTEEDFKKILTKILTYKKAGYNILNSYQYLNIAFKKNHFCCHAPKCIISVDANGNIIHFINALDKKWGNVKTDSFKDIFNSKEFKQFLKESEKCNKCRYSCVIEISLAYSLNPRYLIERIISSRFSYL